MQINQVHALLSERIDQSAHLNEQANLMRNSDWSMPVEKFLPHTLRSWMLCGHHVSDVAAKKGGSPMYVGWGMFVWVRIEVHRTLITIKRIFAALIRSGSLAQYVCVGVVLHLHTSRFKIRLTACLVTRQPHCNKEHAISASPYVEMWINQELGLISRIQNINTKNKYKYSHFISDIGLSENYPYDFSNSS